ncbi:MAG: hypothetical protein K2H67_07245, partial [Treponemataceae bacterium]|nr:hypothetical protein [Treponemataceae bacterium]
MKKQKISSRDFEASETKSIKNFSPLPTWIVSLTHPKIVPHSIAYLHAVAADFFGIQFLRKLKLVRIPILNVETPLDNKVPFVPQCINDYLGFVNFWIRPLAMLIKILGTKKAAPHLVKYFSLLRKSYKYASQIYRFCMTTTNRPLYKKRTSFVVMRMLDPHYLCVPSLHIAIVILCYAFFRDVLQKEDFTREQRELWTREIYEGAIKIAETVLYVKQHSVNCIPAALYMMTKILPKNFSENDAQKFLSDMFATRDNISESSREEIVNYMKDIFARFYEEGKNSAEGNLPIKNLMKMPRKNAWKIPLPTIF